MKEGESKTKMINAVNVFNDFVGSWIGIVMKVSPIGVQLGVGALVQTVLTATLLSMGGNGIPGSGIVKTLVLVQALGLPIEIVGIVAAFYRIFDMGTTTNNCLGDLAGTIVVSKLEERREAKLSKA